MISFPPDLPISIYREQIESAIKKNQVVVICGDTGSGKTTQLPKMALELGRGRGGRRIACTQPRRLAATTVATRVAEEFSEEIGKTVGFHHRFEKRDSAETRIVFMTDGILLAQTRSDPLLRAYDTIIIDEAHERSLNIDFLLGFLKRLLPKRRDLKVIISSATIDSELFSSFFENAATLSIPGRLFPISIEYQPPVDDESDLARDVACAVHSLPQNGDILVFLPGERDIREAKEALAGEFGDRDEIIPLIASLPASEQRRAFRLSSKRRIILATNVAETSVTIPGIRFVIDSGLARISRYNHRMQVQRLQIEPVSQASCNQRAGRSGRLGPGKCIRLFSEEEFVRREKYSTPEILRTSLAGTILTMLNLGLGDISSFPFITPPDNSMIRGGMRELTELGAIRFNPQSDIPVLTKVGKALAAMPIGPRVGRIILAANDEVVLPLILPVAAYMASEDPRRRSAQEREKADAAHAKFKAPSSDFASILKLWRWWERETQALSQNQARKLAKANFLSFTKMREWGSLTKDLKSVARQLSLNLEQDTGGDEGFHKALLTGLISRIGLYHQEERSYRGARGTRFYPFPGSNIFKHPPTWVIAGELVETSKLYARDAAAIDKEWIEPIAKELCHYSYSDQEWNSKDGFVRAKETVTLFGLVIEEGRRCDYSRIDQEFCRDILIRRGLLDGDFPNPSPVVKTNIDLIRSVRTLSDKLRRPELFDEEAFTAFFKDAMPGKICTAHALRRWLYKASKEEISSFTLSPKEWIPSEDVSNKDFPDSITLGGVRLNLSYKHSLGDDDGITCTVKASNAGVLRSWHSDWLVPGALEEKLIWMIACLPSAQRRVLSPVSDVVARLMTYLKPGVEPLAEALSKTFGKEFGLRIYPNAWDNIKMPDHFLVRYRIIDDETKRTIAIGRNLDEILDKIGIKETAKCAKSGSLNQIDPDKTYTQWDFPPIKEEVVLGNTGWKVTQYPALKDNLNSVAQATFPDKESAQTSHNHGVARLYLLGLNGKVKNHVALRPLPMQAKLYLSKVGYNDESLLSDLLFNAFLEAYIRNKAPIRTKEDFERRPRDNQESFSKVKSELQELLFNIITLAADISLQLDTNGAIPTSTKESVKNQLAWLVFPSFARTIPLERLSNYPRYLMAMNKRIEKARLYPSQDEKRDEQVQEYWQRYRTIIQAKELRHCNRSALVEYRWMVEEYRISLFAQEMKTPYPISPKRLEEKWRETLAR